MRLRLSFFVWASSLLSVVQHTANAFEIPDPNDAENIKQVAASVAWNLASYYVANQTGTVETSIGMLPDPYMWWLGGSMWMTLIEYWSLTGDDSYNALATQGMLAQMGADHDFEPSWMIAHMGNDDQSFWAFAAMAAVEQKFPEPPEDQPGWLALVQAVFNRQRGRWNTQFCGGGLQWQISPLNPGYSYKNTISTGTFMQTAARLFRYTGDQQYAEWAERAYTWMSSDMIAPLISDTFQVFDGSDGNRNCTDLNHIEWSYNIGTVIAASAYMYNATSSPVWDSRLRGLISHVPQFFPVDESHNGQVMVEMACERIATCNEHDQRSFKGYLSRNLAMTTRLAPFTREELRPLLVASAQGAARQCSGGPRSETCGMFWNQTTWDGSANAGAQMSALSVIQNLLIDTVPMPVSASTGGISRGNPDAGTDFKPDPVAVPVTTGNKAAAGILTFVLLAFTIGGAVWMIWD